MLMSHSFIHSFIQFRGIKAHIHCVQLDAKLFPHRKRKVWLEKRQVFDIKYVVNYVEKYNHLIKNPERRKMIPAFRKPLKTAHKNYIKLATKLKLLATKQLQYIFKQDSSLIALPLFQHVKFSWCYCFQFYSVHVQFGSRYYKTRLV